MGKPEVKRRLGRHWHRWDIDINKINKDLQAVDWEAWTGWI